MSTHIPDGVARVVTFDLHYKGAHKISAIRAIRTATGAGLYDAKALIDAASAGTIPVKTTEAQYGRLIAAILADPHMPLSDFRMSNVRIVGQEPDRFDFSKNPPPTYGVG